MFKGVLVAVVLLSTVCSVSAQQWGVSSERAPVRVEASAMPATGVTKWDVASEPVITRGQIASLKAALKLRPEQSPHWGPVENALADIARDRSSVADMSTKLRRLKAVAAPLIKMLDDSQKSEAVAFARRNGYSQLASSF